MEKFEAGMLSGIEGQRSRINITFLFDCKGTTFIDYNCRIPQ